nr:bifunctional DNA primase/polymerase [Branchiibius sp. NY16-3462-2]
MSDSSPIPLPNTKTGYLEAALWWVSRGVAVIPMMPGSNECHYDWSRGRTFDEASSAKPFIGIRDVAQVAAVWSGSTRVCNVGMVCGMPNRVLVVDCDTHKVGQNGVTAFTAWCQVNSVDLQSVPRVQSPSGGMHFYFRLHAPQQSRIGWLPGVDVLADGKPVALPPSIREISLVGDFKTHPRDIGSAFVMYESEGDLLAPPAVPGALLTDVDAVRVQSASRSSEEVPELDWWLGNGFGAVSGSRDTDCLAWCRSMLNQHNGNRAVVEALMSAVWNVTPQTGHSFRWRDALKCLRQAEQYYRADLSRIPRWRG